MFQWSIYVLAILEITNTEIHSYNTEIRAIYACLKLKEIEVNDWNTLNEEIIHSESTARFKMNFFKIRYN